MIEPKVQSLKHHKIWVRGKNMLQKRRIQDTSDLTWKLWKNRGEAYLIQSGQKRIKPAFQNQSSSKIWSYKGVRRTSMLSIFPRRSLKEESCSTEIFFSDMEVVCTTGMLLLLSFLLLATCKYNSVTHKR